MAAGFIYVDSAIRAGCKSIFSGLCIDLRPFLAGRILAHGAHGVCNSQARIISGAAGGSVTAACEGSGEAARSHLWTQVP